MLNTFKQTIKTCVGLGRMWEHTVPPMRGVSASVRRCVSTGGVVCTYQYDPDLFKPYPEPKRWPEKNLVVLQPTGLSDPQNIRTYCHFRANIKYSPKKMWFISSFIRGMSIDEAIKQLSFVPKKGAQIVMEVLREAQEVAVRDHNFELASNMWIGESFATKGYVMKGMRKHARMRFGEIRYFHTHYFVRLVEGQPPHDYYGSQPDGNQRITQWLQALSHRRIDYGL
ncbi:unnamed protein product [Medioppia subpectinata]|uniref:Large ribosomal subunit protein uL22m n=1 Tax=Medioppia subpectinata TaxID=1979941 RepID=A0A7R9Q4D8_9ACAR|nr:unnamed protein product [Medioppia subpectinata]CAG2112179.1 unnamed protein product [Medioppia subpectinata]